MSWEMVVTYDTDTQEEHFYQRHPASREMVYKILSRGDDPDDGRSGFYYFLMPNGDMILGVYPTGETYFEAETDWS
ncbi:MAG: hypothetical protein ACWGQW_02335 [bacterium]